MSKSIQVRLLYNEENFNNKMRRGRMRRYGDNLLCCGISEYELSSEHGRNVMVMYGGCGVQFGAFSKPVEYPKKQKTFDILSFLGLRKDKLKEKSI
jgi:hypothetical protein